MDRKKLLIRIVVLMLLMFAVDRLASMFYWYYTLWWFDVLMHFLGGLWVGLFFIYAFFRKSSRTALSTQNIFLIILWVLLAGILWEIFEFYANNIVGGVPFSLSDTFADVCFDLAGGFTALIYAFKRIMHLEKSKIHPVVEL